MKPPGWWPLLAALLPRLGLIAFVALIAAIVFGAAAVWSCIAIGALAIVVAQTRQLIALGRWLAAPESADFPDAGGVWGEVFLRLSRHLRGDAAAVRDLRAELESFREAIEALPEGIVLLDRHLQILWCNRVADVHLGVRLDRDRGAILAQLLRSPGVAEFLEQADPAAPFVLHSTGSRPRTYALAVVPFGDRRRILVSTDVTDARRAEAMRSDFVANVSHELRTPLTVVAGFLEHFTDDEAIDPAQLRQFAQLMSDQTARMLSLVDDLLVLSRLEAEDAPASEETIDIGELIDPLRDLATGLSQGRHDIRFVSPSPQSSLRGNRKELISAFGNLVSNAIRYTPDGGTITVAWKQAEDGSGAGVFSVQDSGVGIAAEHLPRLTERFYRVDRGRSRDSGGTGLGLAIVKHVLLRHQGSLEIESRPGEGSRFMAVIPSWRVGRRGTEPESAAPKEPVLVRPS